MPHQGVWTGGRELLLLPQHAGRPGTNQQAEDYQRQADHRQGISRLKNVPWPTMKNEKIQANECREYHDANLHSPSHTPLDKLPTNRSPSRSRVR
jgi:hypothetical protein